jgi:putative transposase
VDDLLLKLRVYRRRESSVEDAPLEMYLAGASVRWAGDIAEAFWSERVSPRTVSELNRKGYAQIESWCERPANARLCVS